MTRSSAPGVSLWCSCGRNAVLTRAIGVFVTIGLLASVSSATAELLKVSVPQRGQWDTAVTELGTRGGVFKKYGLDIEVLYTQGGPESHQAVISGSMDVACGGGIESVIGAYSRGAPLRIIGSEMIGSPDTYWYVPSNSPIKSLADAAGKTIRYSQTRPSSHTACCPCSISTMLMPSRWRPAVIPAR